MLAEEQMMLWLRGSSTHNTEHDVCCPDFSCRKPSNRASPSERQAFVDAHLAADQATVDKMLVGFLAKALGTIVESGQVSDDTGYVIVELDEGKP